MLRRLRFLFFTRRRFDRELEEEMRLHRELRAQKLGNANAAGLRFGNILRLREESRDAWGWNWVESVAQDLRYAIRVLKASPLFTVAAVLTLALGIGANAALFTLVNALLLKPLPIYQPQRLARLILLSDNEAGDAFCYPALEAIAQNAKTLRDVFTWYSTSVSLGRGTDARTLPAATASGSAFVALGIQPQVGRFFTPQDDSTGAPLVAVLTDRFWQSEYNRDAHVIGKTLLLKDHSFLVIGVAPRSFSGLSVGEAPDLIIPFTANALLNPGPDMLHQGNVWWLPVFARLNPGVSLQQANTELRVLSAPVLHAVEPPRLTHSEAREYFAQTLGVKSGAMGAQFVSDRYRHPLLILIGISALVLLVACVNIASLLLARTAARSREIAVRLAVGAARWRVVRQFLTESLLLSLLGALAGILVAWCAIGLSVRFLPFTLDLAPDWHIVAFLASLVLLTAFLFGTAPALLGTDLHASEVLKQGKVARGPRNSVNSLLVSAQVALSLVLLMGATLFIATFENLKWQNLGFDRHNLLFVSLNTQPAGLKGTTLAHFYQQLLERVNTLPGVRNASLSNLTPMTGGYSSDEFSSALWPALSRAQRTVYTHSVSPRYFATMRIPLEAGRDFNPADAATVEPPPAILTATAAHTFFPNGNALGQILHEDERTAYRIVGTVRDTKFASLRDPQSRALYTDAFTNADIKKSRFMFSYASWTLAIRTTGNPDPVVAALRSIVKQANANITLTESPLDTLIDSGLRTEQIVAILSAFFAAVTALLVALGLYGLLAYTVTRRTTEIGVRLALGASRQSVLWLILKDALMLTAWGIFIGIPAVLVAGKLISSMLYGISPSNPATLARCVLIMLAIAASAGLIPAWRAAKVDPSTALRWE
jgi:predicted permease